MHIVRYVCNAVLEALFPRERWVRQFDHLDSVVLARTATRTMVHTRPPCLAPLPYEHTLVRNAVRAAKYYDHERSARLLGETVAPFVAEEVADRRMMNGFERPLCIPIPLSRARYIQRGYNQSERIVATLVDTLDDTAITVDTAVLTRVSSADSQVQQASRRARLENMKGAFAVLDPVLIRGRDVILVDDVITTGATMRAAELALLDAGAREVLCVAVAH